MSPRHFLSTDPLTGEEIQRLVLRAHELKRAAPRSDAGPLAGKTLAMIFQKPSNRTRLSFEVGMHQLGGKAVYISGAEIGMGEREPIIDVARVMSRYVDSVMIRANYHSDVVAFAAASRVPVINGLSDLEHPCQAMADLLTIYEHFKTFDGLSVCYIGDGNNVCNSLISVCSRLKVPLRVASPSAYEPIGDERRAACEIFNDPRRAIAGADVVYTDTWTSMGQEEQSRKRRRAFQGFTINPEMMKRASSRAIFMHCLPAHRGEEVDDEVFEGPQSVVFDQAENRLHAQKAVLLDLLAS